MALWAGDEETHGFFGAALRSFREDPPAAPESALVRYPIAFPATGPAASEGTTQGGENGFQASSASPAGSRRL
jgi:hypothetical protein